MVQSFQLMAPPEAGSQSGMRRLNRLPVIVAIVLVALFLAVVIIGLSFRGLSSNDEDQPGDASRGLATSFADQLKQGVANGIIGEPEQQQLFQPAPPAIEVPRRMEVEARPATDKQDRVSASESDEEWKARLKREQDEQYIREMHRQRMARLQAQASALDSPVKIDVSDLAGPAAAASEPGESATARRASNPANDLYASAMRSGLLGQDPDPNGQIAKDAFFNQDIKELGYLPGRVVPQFSHYELKRGSVIPAILISGLNSDLPGRITAQVSQNVYDSATGDQLLIPQGAKLFGRYDSSVSFGQDRVLVVWTDLVFPDGSTLQIGGMAGTDAEGYGGFADKVDRHLLRTFGSAALVALIGTGIDLSLPESSTLATQATASDAARRNFAESFGRVAEQTMPKNLNVQPTITIRPGYRFNVLVDQDIVFPPASR